MKLEFTKDLIKSMMCEFGEEAAKESLVATFAVVLDDVMVEIKKELNDGTYLPS